ncbi:MAG: MerR family transcriptional regulator [Roseicyclus sp.]|nr:MerR family transcriptional regulator [Roseicyclus sp.]
MPKSAQAFRTIREVADWLDVAAHVLRFWESKFSQIKPVKRAGGRRYYRPADMELVGGIKVLLHDRGLTIRGVQKMIADEGLGAVTALSPPVSQLLGQLSDGADVIDLDPADALADAWDEDAAADAATPADTPADQNDETDLPEAELELGLEQSGSNANGADPQDLQGEAPTPTEPVEGAAVIQAQDTTPTDPATTDAAAPTETGSDTDNATTPDMTPDAPPPEPESTPETTRPASPSPDGLPRPALPAALPASDPAEGRLGALAALTTLPPEHRATLAPQIAALAHLRDRMAAPRNPH